MRVVIGEDEALLREGLALLLRRARFDVVAAVGDADSLVAAALEHRPQVVVTDIRMPPTGSDDGLRAGLALRARLPGTGLLVLSGHLSTAYAVKLLSSGEGGVGYLWKQRVSDAGQFARSVHAVAAGRTVLDPELTAAALDRTSRAADAWDGLSRRQLEVLELLAQGMTNAAIADALFIKEKSVVEHVSKIYDQLDLPTSGQRRVLATLRFLSSGTD